MSGEPFDNWAGPVSTAFGIEHRKESVDGSASALDEANAFFAGNYHATIGEYDVTEAFLETVVPLLKDVPARRAVGLQRRRSLHRLQHLGRSDDLEGGRDLDADSGYPLPLHPVA